ncbi:MAG: hypothetical protein WC009_10760 [Methylotenera sp.]
MAENNNLDRAQSVRNEQADAFLQIINSQVTEEKGRLLQKHPELTNIVDYYEVDLKLHANNPGFKENFENGRYVNTLLENIRHGQLHEYDSPAQSQNKSHLVLANKDYDSTTKILTGFDINLGDNQKPLHIDLSHYSPKDKSPEETQKIREDFYDVYQSAINRNPDKAEITFKKIAESFPDGISWRSPDQELNHLINSHVLSMQGVPNLGVIASKSFGEAFMRIHNDRADSPLRHGDVDIPKSKLVDLKTLSETINQNDYFTKNQKQSLNQLIAENFNQTEFLRLVPGQQLS